MSSWLDFPRWVAQMFSNCSVLTGNIMQVLLQVFIFNAELKTKNSNVLTIDGPIHPQPLETNCLIFMANSLSRGVTCCRNNSTWSEWLNYRSQQSMLYNLPKQRSSKVYSLILGNKRKLKLRVREKFIDPRWKYFWTVLNHSIQNIGQIFHRSPSNCTTNSLNNRFRR